MVLWSVVRVHSQLSFHLALCISESRRLSVIPGIGITKCGYIERGRTWTLIGKQKAFQCPNVSTLDI